MSTTVYVDSAPYDIPVTDETGWGDDVTAWVIDISAKVTARHEYTNQATVDLFELTANGTNKIQVRAPAAVASDYYFTLPASPGGGGILQIDAAGDVTIASPLSLDTAYINGKTIAADSGPITINKSDNTVGVYINKTATGAGYPLRIDNAGTSAGWYVEIKATSTAAGGYIYVGASVDGLYIDKADSGAGNGVTVVNLGTGSCLDLTQTGAGTAINVTLGAAATWGLGITNHGSNDAIVVVSDSIGRILYGEQTGNATSVTLVHSGDSDVIALSQAGSGRSIYIDHNAAGADDVFAIENAGVGNGVSVICTANGQAGYFKKDTGALPCVFVDNYGTGPGVHIVQTTGAAPGAKIEQNAASYGVQIVKWNTGGTYPALHAQNDGTASTVILVSTNATCAEPVLALDQTGTGNDIEGTGTTWAISKVGQMTVTGGGGVHTFGFSMRTSSLSISTGVITVTSATGTIRLTAESNPDDLVTINGAAYDGQIIILIGGAVSGVVNVLETGNIVLGASTRSLSDVADRLTLQWDSTYSGGKWVELAFADNA